MTTETKLDAEFAHIPWSHIISPGNLRHDIGDVTDLAESIRSVGLLEPIVVRPGAENGQYELLDGHRRLAALQLVDPPGKRIAAYIRKHEGDLERTMVQLIANLQRRDLNPIEEAGGYAQLKGHGWKQSEIAKRIGRSEAHVSKRLSLLELPDRAFDLHDAGRIGPDSLYELTKVVSAGGDLDPILDHLAQTDIDDTPHAAEEVNVLVDRATARAKIDTEVSARKAELTEAGVEVHEPSVDQWGHPKLPKDRIGYDLDLDHDEHLSEPCAYVCLYVLYGKVTESQHCRDKRRHGPDGVSELKLAQADSEGLFADDGPSEEDIRQAKHRDLTTAMARAAESVLEGRAPARDTVLQRLCVLYLEGLAANTHKRAVKLLDLSAEADGEYKALTRLYENADTTGRHRVLLAAVLADGHERCSPYQLYDDARMPHLSFLAELGHSIRNPEIHGHEPFEEEEPG